MYATLSLAAFLMASPVPKDTKPAGPAPRLLEFVPDSDGKIRVTVRRTETRKVPQARAIPKQVQINGQVVQQMEVVTEEREVKGTRSLSVELGEIKDLTIYTADGKEADKALALKKLADGGMVVVSTDGQKVDPKFLKLFRDDTLVLVSPELVTTASATNGVIRQLQVAPAGLRPALPPQAVPPLPVQIQIAPAAEVVPLGNVVPQPAAPALPPPAPPARKKDG